jgi:hypothetical protein
MTDTLPTTTTPSQTPICAACVGDRADPTTRQPCLRCKGTDTDPDPLAPAGIAGRHERPVPARR